MASGGLFFASSTRLRVVRGQPVLGRRGSPVEHRLQLGEAIALTFLSSLGRRGPAASACAEHLNEAGDWVDRAIDRYWSYLGGDAARPLDFGWLDQVDFEALSRPPASRRQSAPHALVWLVTLGCNRRCPYCFYDVFPHQVGQRGAPADATFSRAAVFRMLAEMQDIGASDLYLTGGEPLLRPDLVDLLIEADRRRVRTHLSTKYPIDAGLAGRLAASKLTSITYSLDAGDPRTADGLAGDKGFLPQALRALEGLVDAGFDPEVNAVVTRANEDHMDQLARVVSDLGVRRLALSAFMPPPFARRNAAALAPTRNDTALVSLVDDLAARWAHALDIRLGDSGQNATRTGGAERPVCEVGYSELHVLPGGGATRCRYLPEVAALEVGTLERHTLMDVWNGSHLGDLTFTSRPAYAGTACASCGSFDRCNDRGRCFVSALQTSGSMMAPDGFCKAAGVR